MNPDKLNFGPSQRYLPALKEGEALTFQLNDKGVSVDTDYGEKLQFSLRVINIVGHPSSSIKPGETYIWNTTCKAARDLHTHLISIERAANEYTLLLQADEWGYRIKEVEG